MADGVDLTFDVAAFDRAGKQIVDRYQRAGVDAVRETTKSLERKLESATQGAVPGRLWRAWASRFYENSSADPAGIIYIKGGARTRGAIAFWTEPGAISGKRDGNWLAIPLPAAGSRGRARDLTPGEWERAHGVRLRFVYRRGKPALLVADNAVLSGRSQIARPNTARRTAAGRGSATVPIFVLLPMVPHRNAISVQPLLDASGGELARAFFAAVRAAG